MNGFLGTGATLRADLNLCVQVTMGLALLVGMLLARRKQFRAHKYCQSSVMVLNLVMIVHQVQSFGRFFHVAQQFVARDTGEPRPDALAEPVLELLAPSDR